MIRASRQQRQEYREGHSFWRRRLISRAMIEKMSALWSLVGIDAKQARDADGFSMTRKKKKSPSAKPAVKPAVKKTRRAAR